LLKRWTVLGQITAGSGLPETPVYLAAVTGTGVTGSIGPSVTGAPLFAAPAGHHLNPQLTGRLRRVNGEMREETQ
jgi:hypothetical protein